MTNVQQIDLPALDLSNCDKEPIHIPNAVQAHGVLVVVSEPDLIVQQISQNCTIHFGVQTYDLLGKSLGTMLGLEASKYLTSQMSALTLDVNPTYLPTVKINDNRFEPTVHRYHGATIIEFERQPEQVQTDCIDDFNALRTIFNQLNHINSLSNYCQAAATAVRAFNGFDRVMVYRFLEDGAGHVIAEARRDDLEPYLNLHYPASDIPLPARRLFMLNRIRLIPDVDADSAPLEGLNDVTLEALDMSYTGIRAVSPIHIEYLKNMGVSASMSISIVNNGSLWGLIACHHDSPRFVPHKARMATEFLAQLLSLQVDAKEVAENSDYAARLKATYSGLMETVSDKPYYFDALIDSDINICSELDVDGAAMIFHGQIKGVGITPEQDQMIGLVNWLNENQKEELFATSCLSALYPAANRFPLSASGLMSARLGRGKSDYLLWFRGEYVHTVNWAGDPNKPVTTGEHGDRLTPRKSFELWQQTVIGKSKPWLKCELEHGESLWRLLIEVVLRRADEVRAINEELNRSNEELDSFAYVASHDLKEPLRGINNYSHFLLEDYKEKIDIAGQEKLKAMVKITERMEDLLNSLLYFSQIDRRSTRSPEEVDLNDVIQDSLLFLQARIEESGVEIRLPKAFPTLSIADASRLREIFSNLISNAIKYNNQPDNWVEISYNDGLSGQPIFYVRDNGIGIAPVNHDNIFRLFKRLHSLDHYGGGIGAGLAIVKKIVENLGGEIWLESELGKGTTFYFTLTVKPV